MAGALMIPFHQSPLCTFAVIASTCKIQQGPECLRKLLKPILYSRSLGPPVQKDVQFCQVTTLPGSDVQGRLVACLGCCVGVAARVVNNVLRPPPLAFLRHLGCNLGLCQLPSAAIALHEPLNLRRQACIITSFPAIQRLSSRMWTQQSGFACTPSLNAPPSKQVSAFYGRRSTPALQGQLQPGLWAMSACMPLSHRAAACPSPASTSCIFSLIFHSPSPLQSVTKMQIVRNGCFMGVDGARARHSPPVSCIV